MEDRIHRLMSALEKHCRLITAPVGVKLAEPEETPPDRLTYPLEQLGHPLAVCQGMSLARTLRWSMGFRAGDHACPLPRVFMGHIDPAKMLSGAIAGFYQEDPECMKKMEASYPRWDRDRFSEIWLSPLDRCPWAPDLVVAYGNPAQILTLIQAANFGRGPGIQSTSTGRYGCAAWIAGVVQADACTYMIPGPGERVFAGTQDHEISFAVPASRIDGIVEGLAYIHKQGAYRYPVPNLGLLAEPKIPEKYRQIEPKAAE